MRFHDRFKKHNCICHQIANQIARVNSPLLASPRKNDTWSDRRRALVKKICNRSSCSAKESARVRDSTICYWNVGKNFLPIFSATFLSLEIPKKCGGVKTYVLNNQEKGLNGTYARLLRTRKLERNEMHETSSLWVKHYKLINLNEYKKNLRVTVHLAKLINTW